MTDKVYQLKTMGICAALLRKTITRIVCKVIDFSWNDADPLFPEVGGPIP